MKNIEVKLLFDWKTLGKLPTARGNSKGKNFGQHFQKTFSINFLAISGNFKQLWFFELKKKIVKNFKQAGAELGQAQYKIG